MKNAPNKQELHKMAVDAIRNGQKQPARMMLQQILRQDQRDVRAMTLLAKIAPNPEERAKWLKRVLQVKPKDKAARKALSKLESRDAAKRNRLFLRAGSAVYVLVVLVVSIIMIVSAL